MIVKLTGILAERASEAVIEVSGVGYGVSLPMNVVEDLPMVGETISLYIRHIWREDGATLYGFLDEWSRKLFDFLITVSGVGPKSALGLIGFLGADGLAQAIALNDIKKLQSVPGIGAKTAQRIIVDLGDKLSEAAFMHKTEQYSVGDTPTEIVNDAISALNVMGFKATEAKNAVNESWKTLGAAATLEAVIKDALKRVKTRA